MQSSTIFADQMIQRQESGQLEAAVQRVLRRVLRAGSGDDSSLKKLVTEKFQQLKDSRFRSALVKEDALLAGLSRIVSERLVSQDVQTEIRDDRRRRAETLDFGSTKQTSLLDSLDFGGRWS